MFSIVLKLNDLNDAVLQLMSFNGIASRFDSRFFNLTSPTLILKPAMPILHVYSSGGMLLHYAALDVMWLGVCLPLT